MSFTHSNRYQKTAFRKNIIAQTVITALALTSLSTTAAEEDNSEAEAIDDIIVVTAQKRVQNVMKVPVTVDSVSAETIEESGSILLKKA